MGGGRRTETFVRDSASSSSTNQIKNPGGFRYLTKTKLGGVIFGCKNNTINECIRNQLFGLPAPHVSYVKNIDPGLPLFLFNYSNREIHGIYEAASSGKMNINPYGWTLDGSGRTPYPAQVQMRLRQQCKPLAENLFKPIIQDNYYNENHFLFELDHTQAGNLISKLSSCVLAPIRGMPQNAANQGNIIQGVPLKNREENDKRRYAAECSSSGASTKGNAEESTIAVMNGTFQTANRRNIIQGVPVKNREENDKPRYAAECSSSGASTKGNAEESTTAVMNETFQTANRRNIIQGVPLKNREENDKPRYAAERSSSGASTKGNAEESTIAVMNETFQKIQIQREEKNGGSSSDLAVYLTASIFLVGGYNGVSWLSTLESYSPSNDVLKSLKSITSARTYAAVAKLCGELFVIGGGGPGGAVGTGKLWYDTVESYRPADNKWTIRSPLNTKKGALAGVTWKDKIFTIGGGNVIGCFSEVEMYDPEVGHWINTRPMSQKRSFLAAAELNGVLYAIGGYDGSDYVATAERFDPREHSWTKITSMSTRRACHALAVLDGKLYALGGYDGSTMVRSTEIYDPRLGTWMAGEPMKLARGYAAAAVLQESIYVIGGIKANEEVVDMIECYKEGQGWQTPNLTGIGKRCLCSAIVLAND